MNIEQIAYEQASGEMLDYFSKEQLAAFLHRCLSKLAENEVEPVGWLCDGRLYEVQQYRLFTGDGPIPGQEKLYTETQLIAAQQRTAKACAKLCEFTADKYQETESRLWPECRSDAQSGAGSCEGSIRNGDWREYL